MRHQLVSCDACQREDRDPEGWFAIRYFQYGMVLDVPMIQIEEVIRWNDQNERNPDMEREFLCSPACVCKRLRSILKYKQKARLKAITARDAKLLEAPKGQAPRRAGSVLGAPKALKGQAPPAVKQIEAPKAKKARALLQ